MTREKKNYPHLSPKAAAKKPISKGGYNLNSLKSDKLSDRIAVEILHKPYHFSKLESLLRKYVPGEQKSGTERAINVGVEQR